MKILVQQIMISHYATRVSNARSIVTLSTTGYYASPCYSVLSPQSVMTDPRSCRLASDNLTSIVTGPGISPLDYKDGQLVAV